MTTGEIPAFRAAQSTAIISGGPDSRNRQPAIAFEVQVTQLCKGENGNFQNSVYKIPSGLNLQRRIIHVMAAAKTNVRSKPETSRHHGLEDGAVYC